MSYFNPFTRYETRLPTLRPGHIIRIADKYYMIVTKRTNPKKVTTTGAQTDYRFKTETSSTFTDMHGKLSLNRIVHIQYVAIDVDTNTRFNWGTQPLQSKDVNNNIQTWAANLSAPMEVDRWSYEEEMHLYVTTAATQNFYFMLIEYEVVPYLGEPTTPFLHIMANGQAIFVEHEGIQKTLAQVLATQPRPKGK